MDTYFVLTSDEDGISIDPIPKDVLEKRLLENWYGSSVQILDHVPEIDKGFFFVPGAGDKRFLLIIKGKVVVPQPVQKVTKYQVE